jgi:hypothetical protein
VAALVVGTCKKCIAWEHDDDVYLEYYSGKRLGVRVRVRVELLVT